MAIDLDSLSPYKSLLVCYAPKGWSRATAMTELATTVSGMDGARPPFPANDNPRRHSVAASFFYYQVEGGPFWLSNHDLTDRVHELAMIFQRGPTVAFLASEKRLRDRIHRLVNKANGTALGLLKPVPKEVLNAAFVRGEMKAAWTTSTGRRTETRPDSKNYGGPNVRLCLDPTVDQTFSLAASVNRLPGKEYDQPIGAAPRKSNIWAGASPDGDSLCRDVGKLMKILKHHRAKPVANPVPGFAYDIDDPAALKNVKDAFSAALIPMELLDQNLPVAAKAEAEKWSRLEFEVTKAHGLGFEADILLRTGVGALNDLGSIRVTIDDANPSSVEAASLSTAGADQDEAVDAINQNPGWLRVWYESGHCLGEGVVSANRFRHMPFEYSWVDFNHYDVTTEKPAPLQPQFFGKKKSLFCWVVNEWSPNMGKLPPKRGWLACNDGSLEIADFIHLDAHNGVLELTLIHAKACHNGKANRPVSVGDFELVVSQAQKNLAFLDGCVTADEFETFLGKGVQNAVFHNGVLCKRADMLKELRKLKDGDYQRRVVILQPRVTKSALSAARTGQDPRQKRIVQQLDLLLLGLRARCVGFGAELVVTGHDC